MISLPPFFVLHQYNLVDNIGAGIYSEDLPTLKDCYINHIDICPTISGLGGAVFIQCRNPNLPRYQNTRGFSIRSASSIQVGNTQIPIGRIYAGTEQLRVDIAGATNYGLLFSWVGYNRYITHKYRDIIS